MSVTPRTDPDTGAEWDISVEHGMIHAGRMFSSCFITTNIAVAGVTNFLLRNGAQEVHFVYRVESDKQAIVNLYENPTVTVAGAGMAELNVNRNSANTTLVTCFSGSTIAANGTPLESHILGTAAAGGSFGGEGRAAEEWEGLVSEDYLVAVQTLGVNTRINLCWRWYEIP